MTIAGFGDSDVYIRDKATCVYCGLSGMWNFGIYKQLEIDHIIPESMGGPNSPANKVVACHRCNNLRVGYDPSDGKPSIELNDENCQKLIGKGRRYIQEQYEGKREVEIFLELMQKTSL